MSEQEMQSANDGTAQTPPYVALVLQGGGALGAYHIGAYQALQEAGYTPQWVTGVSIGAVNAALIAGNAPDQRLQAMEEFWHIISRPSFWDQMMPSSLRRWFNTGSAIQALMFGQPNFSRPFFVNPYLAPAGTPAATGVYDSTPLRETLERMVNFDMINACRMRLSLGVTKVRTGNVLFFDNTNPDYLPFGSDHVIASSAIPPMYPGVRVKGDMYWDGGVVDNTPLEPVLADQDEHPDRHTLVFMIDLWDGSGPEPQTMDEVMWRQYQIQFASRTERHIRQVVEQGNMRRALRYMAQRMSAEELSSVPVFMDGETFEYGNLDIVRITYEPRSDQTSLSYVDFSRGSIAQRQQDGYSDMKMALEKAPWITPKPADDAGAAVSFATRGESAFPRAAIHHMKHGQVESTFPGIHKAR